MLTAVLLCSKFYNDLYYSNEHVGTQGGICCQEMNLLEAYFLESCNYHLHINEVEYAQYFELLQMHIQEITRIKLQADAMIQAQFMAQHEQLQMQLFYH